ncbi:DUF6082 family protein [Streptomyces sp. NPDC088789]|uniref:DUF6082 family protein n=1 Tax=Streptomyces sp. NPDC088789 TaxID=3365899 RepID=UPI00381A3C96
MKVSTAVLLAGAAVAGIGTARFAQERRHQQERNHTALTHNQLDWLKWTTSNSDLAKLWMPDDVDSVEEYQHMLHANHQLCALSLRHRLGFVNDEKLRLLASVLMAREVTRNYWKRFGSFRAEEAAGDKRAERFTEALDTAARAHTTD